MRVYCVTKNTGPSWTGPDPLHLVYIGTSIKEAEESVGDFLKYERDESRWPVNFRECYTIVPSNLEPEMIQFYVADGWWFSIVTFELKETDNAE